MASIRVRSDRNGRKRYLARVRVSNKDIAQTFDKLQDAKEWARKLEGRISSREYQDPSDKTLADAIDRYIQQIMPEKAETTARHQLRQLAWWKVQLGDIRLDRLTPALIGEQRDQLIAERGVSGPTANRYLAVLSHVLAMCLKEWEWIKSNPVSRVSRRKENTGRVRYLDRKELSQLVEACKNSRQKDLYLVVLLALSTGARRGEIMNLCWRNVDLRRGFIYLLGTKNGTDRAVPVTGDALLLLKQRAKVKRLDSDLVFPAPSNPLVPVDMRTAFEDAVRRAQISDFKFHDLRHCAASYLAMSGASLAEIAEVLGHRTLAMVKRYAHLSQDHVSGVVQRMNREWLNSSG